jgi:hypothetical protein
MIGPDTRLTVKTFGGILVPVCDSRRHTEHDGLTCDEADAQIAACHAALDADIKRALRMLERTDMADVPPALRGPQWKEAT